MVDLACFLIRNASNSWIILGLYNALLHWIMETPPQQDQERMSACTDVTLYRIYWWAVSNRKYNTFFKSFYYISYNVYFQWVRYQPADMATVATDTATSNEGGGDPVMPLASPKCGHCEMTFSNISDLFHHMKVSGNITLFALWCLSKWNWQSRNCTCTLLVYNYICISRGCRCSNNWDNIRKINWGLMSQLLRNMFVN